MITVQILRSSEFTGMKFITVLLLTVSIFGFGCRRAKENPSLDKLSLNDTSYIEFHVKNVKNPSTISMAYYQIFPPFRNRYSITFTDDTVELVRLIVNHLVTIQLDEAGSVAYCQCLPKDTLAISIDKLFNKQLRESISFSGKTGSVSNYLTNTSDFIRPVLYKSESPESFNKRIDDDLTDRRLVKLHQFDRKVALPDWFIRFEELNIKYYGASEKINQYKTRKLFRYNYSIVPNDLDKKLKIPFYNSNARNSIAYNSFLNDFSTLYDGIGEEGTSVESVNPAYVKRKIEFGEKYLHSEVKEIFLAQNIIRFFMSTTTKNSVRAKDRDYISMAKYLMNYAADKIKDKTILVSIKEYYDNLLSQE
jgi:hypothetical protein